MNGQEIAKELEKRRGEKPSPGTIYPALKHLKEEGLIQERKSGKTITHTLTEQGKETLKIAKRRFCKIFVDIL